MIFNKWTTTQERAELELWCNENCIGEYTITWIYSDEDINELTDYCRFVPVNIEGIKVGYLEVQDIRKINWNNVIFKTTIKFNDQQDAVLFKLTLG
jgi:hypothetical protein